MRQWKEASATTLEKKVASRVQGPPPLRRRQRRRRPKKAAVRSEENVPKASRDRPGRAGPAGRTPTPNRLVKRIPKLISPTPKADFAITLLSAFLSYFKLTTERPKRWPAFSRKTKIDRPTQPNLTYPNFSSRSLMPFSSQHAECRLDYCRVERLRSEATTCILTLGMWIYAVLSQV